MSPSQLICNTVRREGSRCNADRQVSTVRLSRPDEHRATDRLSKQFGPNALARFGRDVVAVPGVSHVVLLEGINDIGLSGVLGGIQSPAVTIARAFSDTFAGIRPADVGGFLVAQAVGATVGALVLSWLVPIDRSAALTTS